MNSSNPFSFKWFVRICGRNYLRSITEITQEHLEAVGDVNQALSRFYERSILRAAQETPVSEGDLREWFQDSLITPAGTRGTVYQGRDRSGGIPNAAVRVLEDLHLIRGEWRGRRTMVRTDPRPVHRADSGIQSPMADRKMGGGTSAQAAGSQSGRMGRYGPGEGGIAG